MAQYITPVRRGTEHGQGVYRKPDFAPTKLTFQPQYLYFVPQKGSESMNTLQNLLDNGIDIHTAIRMLDDYQKRIGTDNGIYIITDITYDFDNRGKDVTLKCRGCGREIHRLMISQRNKWSELIKSCPCEKERKEQLRKTESEKSRKIKKEREYERACSFIGKQYGDYFVSDVGYVCERLFVELRCSECGEIRYAPADSVCDSAEKYKKCTAHYNPIKFDESYIGKKNNMLTVIGITRLPNKHRAFICECDCGGMTTLEPVHWERGIVKSCGCLQKSLQLEHSEELDRLRRIHNGMMQRCYNEKSEAYRNYGGRGICICEEWHDREKFIEWALKNGYHNSLSIDRINANGNYEPDNCRWADAKTQCENRRSKSEWKKREKRQVTKRELYKLHETSQPAVSYRMQHFGMTFEEALVAQKRTSGRPRKAVR